MPMLDPSRLRKPTQVSANNAPLLARVSGRFNVNVSTSSSKIRNISIVDMHTRNGASPAAIAVSALRAYTAHGYTRFCTR